MAQTLLELINAKKQQIDANKRPNAKKIAPGRSRLRILPSWRPNDEQFWHDYGQHFIKDANGDTKAVYICTERTFGRPCEVCSTISSSAKSTGDDALTKIITEAKASPRTLVNALHIDGQAPTTPEVYEIPPSVFEQFIGLMQLYLQEGVNILDLNTGFDVSIERTGTGLNTKYTLAAAPKTSSVNPEVMTKIQDLDKYVAQENEQNRVRAISEVRQIAGLLPNSSGTTLAALPASTANLLDVEEDLTQQIPTGTAPAAIASAAPVVTDVAFTETAKPAAATIAAAAQEAQAVQASVAATVASAAAAVSSGTGDAELDDLLATLNNA